MNNYKKLLFHIEDNNIKGAKEILESIIHNKIDQRYENAMDGILIKESIDARIDDIMQSAFFSVLGRGYIEDKFNEYKSKGVVPTQRVNLNDTSDMVDLEERELEEVLPYIFKFVDKKVKDDMTKLLGDDQKKINKMNNHYSGVTLKPAIEDASQIKGVLTNWFAFRNKKQLGVPKSLRQKIDFGDLQKKTDEAYEKMQSGNDGDEKKGNDPDYNMPDGFEFIKESGNLRLYRWHTLGDVCSLDKTVRRDWLSLTIDVAGDEVHDWCVNSSDYAQNYGFDGGSGSGKFDYPYYMVREKRGNRYAPKYLLHGNSKQAKDEKDIPMVESMADEVMGGLISEEMINKIYEGNS